MTGEFKRLKDVMDVLSRHGLGSVLVKYGFAWYLPFFKRRIEPLPSDLPVRLRSAMEELGGAYIKLGQMLSLREDLIPSVFCDEFSNLLDNTPAEPFENIASVIEDEFRHPLNDIFSSFDPLPVGSASVAQVHKARLKNGSAVAVKVQRRFARAQFENDISIMRHIALKVKGHIKNGFDPLQIVEEFERYTEEELSFVTEASHLDETRKANPNRNIVIPRVFWDFTRDKILVMEYLDGIKLSDIKTEKRSHVAHSLCDLFIYQIFHKGIFHADLHPGNVLLLKNNKLGLLDFGIVGHLDERTQNLGFRLYTAILERDVAKIADVLLTYGTVSGSTNVPLFTRSVRTMFNKWWEDNPENRRVTHLMRQLFILCPEHKISVPRDAVLLGKAMVTLESTCRKIDPHFDFVRYSEPAISKLLKERRAPKKMIGEFTKKSYDFVKAISYLPAHALKAVDNFNSGNFSISLKDTNFRHLGQDINLSSNRVSYALVSAALILASAWMIEIGPKIGSFSLISLFALCAACVFVLALFLSISREQLKPFDPHN